MTLGDLLKRIDLDKDCDKMFILRDSNGGWTNVHFIIQDNEISIVEAGAMPLHSDDLLQSPYAPPYKIGDEDYIDRVYCEHDTTKGRITNENNTNGDWQKSVRYI